MNAANSYPRTTAKILVALSLTSALAPVAGVQTAFAGTDDAPAHETAKNEIVYVKADAHGDPSGMYVVNFFDAGPARTLTDPAAYDEVTNLSTVQDLAQEDGAVAFSTEEGKPFYYQGTMDASTTLPWNIDIAYRLDGRPVSADEAAGASGELSVDVTIKPNAGDEAVSDFAQSYILQAQTSFSHDNFLLDDAQDATVAISGSDTLVTYMVLPGKEATFTIKGQAAQFQYPGWQVSAMPLSLSINLSDYDLSKLTASAGELEGAVAASSDGSSAVDAGAFALSQGAEGLAEGLATINGNGGSIEGGLAALSSGIADARAGADALAQGSAAYASQLASAKASSEAGAAQLPAAQQAYEAAMGTVRTELATTNTVKLETLAALNEAVTSLAQASGAAGANEALGAAVGGYAAIDEGIASLSCGMADLGAGAASLGSGMQAYLAAIDEAASGAGRLSQGASALSGGSAALSNGLSMLHASVKGMDAQILGEVQAEIDRELGGGFKPRSFAVPSNDDVEAVQFVYVIDGANPDEAQESEDASEPEGEPAGVLDRIAAVFAKLFGQEG